MADKRVRSIVQDCLGKSGTLSLREDVMGVYGNDNPTDRRLKAQLNLIENRPFVRVALVTIRPVGSTQGQNANLQRDLDNANLVYQNECNAWVYPVGSRVVRTNILGANGLLDQDDCSTSHSVSDEEDDLFDLGRNMGADVVCYYIAGDVGGFRGCAAHPNNRRGFWVGNTATQWTFVHELTHVVGDNRHVADDPDVPDTRDNLMWPNTGQITNAPPDLETVQCNRITGDQDMERC
jgi:hypothetical protein